MRIQPIPVPIADRPGDPPPAGPAGDLVAGLHAASEAAYTEDLGPAYSLPRFRRDVCTNFPNARAEAWVVAEDGQVVAGYGLSLPQLENLHAGRLLVLAVRPEHRRRGLGTALLEHAVERLRAHGRTLLFVESPAEGTGAAFARARGMTPSLGEARRTLDLRKADWTALERMLPEVPGYRLERWVGPATGDFLSDMTTLLHGMNDAPRDGDIESSDFSVERVRAREESLPDTGMTAYSTIAYRDADGAPAGYTRLFLTADRSDGWAEQGDTTVLSEHRGRRLGLLVKLSNLFWLRDNEPHLERIITWNATSNAHMLAINEAMGFELFDEWTDWRLEA